jgi:hypothetical protein
LLVAACVLVALPAPARASGETLTASPTRGAPGAAVHLDYETNYGPGGCERGQVVQLFFDASPVATAAMDPARCGAARVVRVPSGSCGRHVFRAAWRTGSDPTLYGEATAAFDVLCTAPPASSPASRPRGRPRTTRAADTPSPSPSPLAPVPTRTVASPVVPLVTHSPSPAAAQDGPGTAWPVWLLVALALAGGAVAVGRRWRT